MKTIEREYILRDVCRHLAEYRKNSESFSLLYECTFFIFIAASITKTERRTIAIQTSLTWGGRKTITSHRLLPCIWLFKLSNIYSDGIRVGHIIFLMRNVDRVFQMGRGVLLDFSTLREKQISRALLK